MGCTQFNFHIFSVSLKHGVHSTITHPRIFFLQVPLYTIAALRHIFLPHPSKLPLQSHLLGLSSLAQTTPISTPPCMSLLAHHIAYLENSHDPCCQPRSCPHLDTYACLKRLNISVPTRTLSFYFARTEEIQRPQGTSPSARNVLRVELTIVAAKNYV